MLQPVSTEVNAHSISLVLQIKLFQRNAQEN